MTWKRIVLTKWLLSRSIWTIKCDFLLSVKYVISGFSVYLQIHHSAFIYKYVISGFSVYLQMHCIYLTETFAVTHTTKANFPFSHNCFRRRVANIPELFSSCLWQNQDGGLCELVLRMLVCKQKYGYVYSVDIIYLFLYTSNNYWCSLFDLTSNLI